MIINEIFDNGNYRFVRTYSDLSVYIRKVKLGGNEEIYAETTYPIELSSNRIYEETDIPIEPREPL